MKNSSLLHIVKQALDRGGYTSDAEEALDARLLRISQNGPIQLQVLVHNVSCNSLIYLEQDDDQKWTAEY